MKVGTIAYATDQGLGILAKSFVDHGVVTDVLVVRHSSRVTHEDWYPGALQTFCRPFDSGLARAFASQVDVMLFFETPFDWNLIPHCRERGVLTVLMPMYECMPGVLPYQPDRFICPSLLDLRYFPDRSIFLPVPVETPWRQRRRAETFVHNAGNLGLRGRNGTEELLRAMQYARSPLRLVVRGQGRELEKVVRRVPRDDRVTVNIGCVLRESLWEDGDVLVWPEKFDGLSLPLQEARAAGLLVMATDRFPVNTWLPREPLIPVSRYARARVGGSCLEFDEAVVDPRSVAETMDAWYGRDIEAYSQSGRDWAEATSWEILRPRYMEALAP